MRADRILGVDKKTMGITQENKQLPWCTSSLTPMHFLVGFTGKEGFAKESEGG